MLTNIVAAVTTMVVTNQIDGPLRSTRDDAAGYYVQRKLVHRQVQRLTILTFEWRGEKHSVTNAVNLSSVVKQMRLKREETWIDE